MKKLILLLFIPLISFSQISFKDVMLISSLDQFKRVMIENNYESSESDNAGMIVYGLNIAKDSIKGNSSSSWAFYDETDNKWGLTFNRTNLLSTFLGTDADNSENPYDLILEEVKEKCKFYKIITESDNDYACYSCASSTYKGKIGFMVFEDAGLIRHFPED
jgi:hypothetical protein